MKEDFCDCSKTGKEAFLVDGKCLTCKKHIDIKELEEELNEEKKYFEKLKVVKK